MGSTRSAATCLALWVTLFATPAVAGETTPPDPAPDAGLGELIEARAAAGYRWPRARAELQEILADRLHLLAAMRDTVSALRYQHRLDLIAATSREDSLRSVIRWQGWDLEAARDRRQRWYQSPAVVVPLTVLATVFAVDVVVRR